MEDKNNMNITKDIVDEFRGLAKEYDGTSDIGRRRDLGVKIEDFGARLSEKQIIPFLKIVLRR